ncbi:hypothetical protein RHGRI_004724 [Rhododendron griersonianum]|uniref:Adenylate kinase n=1 Tax=Rhododendron griersonianum TaxID=479676 RepID=A0AAV6L9N3_9ERIC|nr:hypothetical protein RHGRI_004724 [Rhododendron griersonianum]
MGIQSCRLTPQPVLWTRTTLSQSKGQRTYKQVDCRMSANYAVTPSYRKLNYVKHGKGVEEIVNHILQAWEVATGKKRH